MSAFQCALLECLEGLGVLKYFDSRLFVKILERKKAKAWVAEAIQNWVRNI